jgi:NhaP-type Na+/H+ and K+/H+ antiporter
MCAVKPTQPALFGVTIQSNSRHCGLCLSAIDIPQHCALLGLLRQEQIILSTENPTICVGDIVLAIAYYPMLVPALKVALKRCHRVYYSLNQCLLNP